MLESHEPVIPVLTATVLCDFGATDPATGKKTLVGIFNQVSALKLPTTQSASVYLCVTDALGEYDMAVRLVRARDQLPIAEATFRLSIKSRLVPIDVLIPPQSYPLPDKGKYEFQVFANAIYLGCTTLEVVDLNHSTENVVAG